MTDWDAVATKTGEQHTRAGRNSTARPATCPGCNQWVITGLDDVRAALTVRINPVPLTRAGEARALMSGAGTFALQRIPGNKYAIRRRDHWQIEGSPADKCQVYAEHSCTGYPATAADVHRALSARSYGPLPTPMPMHPAF